jgi:hypothetical protein
MVVALDLEEKKARKEKLRTGSATGTSAVEEHQCARIRVQPSTHQRKQKRPTDLVVVKHKEESSGAG